MCIYVDTQVSVLCGTCKPSLCVCVCRSRISSTARTLSLPFAGPQTANSCFVHSTLVVLSRLLGLCLSITLPRPLVFCFPGCVDATFFSRPIFMGLCLSKFTSSTHPPWVGTLFCFCVHTHVRVYCFFMFVCVPWYVFAHVYVCMWVLLCMNVCV